MNSDDARKSNGEGLSVSAGEKSESGFVKIHLTKNGFYADPKDIINHPNAKKQLAQARAWLKEQKKG